MKCYILVVIVLISSSICRPQGTTCTTAIPLTLNGSLNNYSTSASTDVNVLCTNNGTTPITWFQFTTNASAECPLLNITVSDGQACEIAMYTSCSGNMNNNFESASSMCFYDGTGLWAPSETYVLSANTTYYLRGKTTTLSTINIGGQHYTPANDECTGAFNIGPTSISDNNSCHKAGPNVTYTQLCASSLENTAFYQYHVATTGTSVININNISCDNGFNNVLNGFQIGFFTGTCSNLIWLSCSSGSGSFVQATTPVLAADTKVYVAVDGNAGSNCKYDIQAINAYTLASEIKKFSAWKKTNENVLKWTAVNFAAKYFEIERSKNGRSFTSLGRIDNINSESESDYGFEDKNPLVQSYYRIKIINEDGKTHFSKTVFIDRTGMQGSILNVYVISNSLHINFNSKSEGKLNLTVINLYGQQLVNSAIFLKKGMNSFEKDIYNLPAGKYFIVLNDKDQKISKGFIKVQGIF